MSSNQFAKMSIQERIRAMNQTIDKVDLTELSSASSPLKNARSDETGETRSPSDFVVDEEEQSYDEQESHQRQPSNKRTSVVDMWRKRETAASEPPPAPVMAAAAAAAASPGRRKSVLEKWTSTQIKQEAQLKVEEKEENKDSDQRPSSVAEMIAKRSSAADQTSAPAPVKQMSIGDMMKARQQADAMDAAASAPAKQLSIADMVKARSAAAVGKAAPPSSAATAKNNVAVVNVKAPSPPKYQETDLVFVDSSDTEDDNEVSIYSPQKATPLKNSVTSKWNQRGLVSAMDTTPLTLIVEPSEEEEEEEEFEAPPQRRSVADIWSKRATSSPSINSGSTTRRTATAPAKPLVKKSPAVKETVSVHEEYKTEPGTRRWGSLRSLQPAVRAPSPVQNNPPTTRGDTQNNDPRDSSSSHSNTSRPTSWASKSSNRASTPESMDHEVKSTDLTASNNSKPPAWAINRSNAIEPKEKATLEPKHFEAKSTTGSDASSDGHNSKPTWANKRSVLSSLNHNSNVPEPNSIPDPKQFEAKSTTGSDSSVSNTSKPTWASKRLLTLSLNRNSNTPEPKLPLESKSFDATSTTGSDSSASNNSKPTWADSRSSGVPATKSTTDAPSSSSKNNKPAWATRILNKSNGTALSSPQPQTNSNDDTSKPAWATKSLKSRAPSSFASLEQLQKPVESARPPWAGRSSPVAARSSPAAVALVAKDEASSATTLVDAGVDPEPEVASSKEVIELTTVEKASPKPKWAGRSSLATKSISSPAPSSDFKPAWMKRSLKSPSTTTPSPSIAKTSSSDSKQPVWMKNSQSAPSPSLVVDSSPAKSVDFSVNQPARMTAKSFTSPAADSTTSRAHPSPSARPSWATASLRKTGISVATPTPRDDDADDDLATIHSEPAVAPIVKKGWNSVSTDDGDLQRKSMSNSWQKKVNRRETSPTKKRRSPSKKQIFAIEMSSKDAVDAAIVQEEVVPQSDELLQPLEIALFPAQNVSTSQTNNVADVVRLPPPEPLSPPRARQSPLKMSPVLDWPSAGKDDDVDADAQAHEDAVQSQASALLKKDSVKTPRSSVGRSSPRSSVGVSSPSRSSVGSFVGRTSPNSNALRRSTPPRRDAPESAGKPPIDAKQLSIRTSNPMLDDAVVADIEDSEFKQNTLTPSKTKNAPPSSPLIELAMQYKASSPRGSVFRVSPSKSGRPLENTNTGSNQRLGARSLSSLSRSEANKIEKSSASINSSAASTRVSKVSSEQPPASSTPNGTRTRISKKIKGQPISNSEPNETPTSISKRRNAQPGARSTPNAIPTRFSQRRFKLAQNHLSSKPSMSLTTVPSSDAESLASRKKEKDHDRSNRFTKNQSIKEVSSPTRSGIYSDAYSVGSTPNTPNSSRLGRAESKKEIQKRRFRMKNRRDPDYAGDDQSIASTSSWISDSKSVLSKQSSVLTVPNPPLRASARGNVRQESTAFDFMDAAGELVDEQPLQSSKSSGNVVVSQPAGSSHVESQEVKDRPAQLDTVGLDEEFARLEMIGVQDELPFDMVAGGQPSPLSNKHGVNNGAFSPYLPEALSPRTLNPNASSRVRHMKELEQRKVRTPGSATGSAARSAAASSADLTDWTFFSSNVPTSPTENHSVISATSGSSALAERASRVLHRRRGRLLASNNDGATTPTAKTNMTSPSKTAAAWDVVRRRQSHEKATKSEHDAFGVRNDNFVAHPVTFQKAMPPVTTSSARQKSSSSQKRSQKAGTVVDRSGFVNRYNSSERFIDTLGDVPQGITPRQQEAQSRRAYSFGSEVSERSSPQESLVSSEDGSRLYLERRSDTLASESTAGVLGIDKNFRDESSSNIHAMRSAYEAVSLSDMAKDLREEVAASLTGSVSVMKNFASELGKLGSASNNNCAESLGIQSKAKRVHVEEEEVAIEIEYIGDYDYPDDEEDFFDKRALQKGQMDAFDQVPAGQSSYEGSFPFV